MSPRRRPSGFWRHTIVEALHALGGEAWMNPDIYDWVKKHVELTVHELSPSPHQDRPYYVNTVRGIAADMVDEGHLIRIHDGLFRLP